MDHKAVLIKSENHLTGDNAQNEYGSQLGANIWNPEIGSQSLEIVGPMMEYELNRFHSKSKKEMTIISGLAREVFLRHRRNEPELVKLVISVYLYFIDYLHYLNIERRFLFPAIIDQVLKGNYLGSDGLERNREIQEAIRNIKREQYYAMGKLRSLRKLTGNYLIPVHACEFRKLLFSKMKKFDNALVGYLHFQYARIFPLIMGG